MNRDERQAARFVVSRDALLTEATAVELLPVRDEDARRWLRARGLVLAHPVLGNVVVWADVLEAVRADAGRPGEPPPAKRAIPATMPRQRMPRRER